ncbi:MAG TPA: Ig-like domain-containing protein [Polyangiales bacterium]
MRSLILVAALMVVGSVAGANKADACSCVTRPIDRSTPTDGATGVALNQAIAIDGSFRTSSVRLEDEQGEPVAFALNAGPGPGCPSISADVVPLAPLKPNTRYVLHVESDSDYPPERKGELHFTTGTEMLPDLPLATPHVDVSVVRDAPEAMCGLPHTVFACVGVEQADDLELIMRRGDEILLRTTTLVQDSGQYSLSAVPDCVELRRRSPTGKRSAPHSICGDALQVRAWTATDSPDGFVSCQAGTIGASHPVDREHEDEGCALGSRGAPSLALLLAGLIALRRRRRA